MKRKPRTQWCEAVFILVERGEEALVRICHRRPNHAPPHRDVFGHAWGMFLAKATKERDGEG